MTASSTTGEPATKATGDIQDGGRGRHANEFWQIPKAGWMDILKRTYSESNDDNVGLLAAGVAFYSFLAFVPMLAAIVLIYGLVADPSDVARHLGVMTSILPKEAAGIIADQLTSLTETPPSKGIIGLLFAILLAIYGAMRGATSVVTALNVTYGEHETRSFIKTTLLSFAITLGVIVSALVAAASIAAMGLVGSHIDLGEPLTTVVRGGTWLVMAVVISAMIAVIYRFGPNREHAQWTWLTPGSVMASVGALLGTFAFGYYVSNFGSYNATYGALGAVVTFLMWLYLAAYVVLMGSELNAEIEHQTATDTTTGPEEPLGTRGAAMADQVAGTPGDVDQGGLEDAVGKASPSSGSAKAPAAYGARPTAPAAHDGGMSGTRTALIFGGLGLALGKHRLIGAGLIAAGYALSRGKRD